MQYMVAGSLHSSSSILLWQVSLCIECRKWSAHLAGTNAFIFCLDRKLFDEIVEFLVHEPEPDFFTTTEIAMQTGYRIVQGLLFSDCSSIHYFQNLQTCMEKVYMTIDSLFLIDPIIHLM